MGAYQYQALKKSGNILKGVIEADSERHARQLLREQDLVPILVHALKKRTLSKRRDALSAAELSLLTRQLATLLAAGIPIEESLRGVAEQSSTSKARQLLIGVRSKVMEGYALAQALSDYPQTFPELYRATVAAGEQTGRLDLVLEKLADYTESQQHTRQKIQQALIYPSLMIIVSISIISFLLAFVVPKIIEVFTSSGQSLPAMTLVLITISHFIRAYGLYALLLLALLSVGFKRSLNNPAIKLKWHEIVLKLPIANYLIKTVNVARYIHTFGILFSAGVNVLETMHVSASLVSNLKMRRAFDEAAIRVREGTSISVALKETGYINPMAAHLIGSGEKSGQLSAMMERAGTQMDREIQQMIDTALTLLEPFVILLMGVAVLFIVLATLLPIFSMEQLVT
jgi:general secretion pathway protein F